MLSILFKVNVKMTIKFWDNFVKKESKNGKVMPLSCLHVLQWGNNCQQDVKKPHGKDSDHWHTF